MAVLLSLLLACASVGSANPLWPRTVSSLNIAAFAEAQPRDNTATRAFSNVQIKISDGRCLFVDELSGDFRANLTPIQVGTCGATDGQGWDVITAGKHINVANSMLIVSTLTQAVFNFDPRKAPGAQVFLFSAGGRADGGGVVTNSQLFSFNGTAGPLPFEPENQPGSCLTIKGNVIDIAQCSSADPNQSFTFGGAAAAVNSNSGSNGGAGGKTTAITSVGTTVAASVAASATTTSAKETGASKDTATANPASTTCSQRTRTVKVTASTANNDNQETTSAASSAGTDETTSATEDIASATETASSAETASSGSGSDSATAITNAGSAIANPTTPVPVSGAGGTLNPTDVAESQQRDDTATRAFSSVEIRAPNGQCMFVNPTAGDFRENLIPIELVDCGGTPNEKWDVITQGKHNNAQNSALIVSSLMQGCVSFDGRKPAGAQVYVFSCGGRADGNGQTNSGQLMPFIGELSFAFAPESENNKVCILPGNGNLTSGPCPTELGPQLFSIFP